MAENFIPIIILVIFAMFLDEYLGFLSREYGFFTMLTTGIIILIIELVLYFLI